MKYTLMIIFILILGGCGRGYQKPFIIICKSTTPSGHTYYEYQDKNGSQMTFYDNTKNYSIGDTIK